MASLVARPSLGLLGREPYRVFFPLASLAGILGVALWPLHFAGVASAYPGLSHARIMAHGLFGGFIVGFLGTAMPRMLSAKPLHPPETFTLLGFHAAMVIAYALGRIGLGDAIFLMLLLGLGILMGLRARHRGDMPPPGFVLVFLAWLAAVTGAVLGVLEARYEIDPYWISLQRLLSYQAFVLLPILGIGPFILPRFLGLPSAHDLPESRQVSRVWRVKASLAAVAGLAILGTLLLEARGMFRVAYGVRFAMVVAYMLLEMPLRRGPGAATVFGAAIRGALVSIVAGFLAIAFQPAYRVGLLHLTLVGGFAVITFVVATRVVYGHSGNLALLKGRNGWLVGVFALMLVGMATRISGDFWPAIMASHYIYGAVLWIAGVVIWGIHVLPKVLVEEVEA